MSKETPISFTGPMVRAILAGRKTQTRRVRHDPPRRRYAVGDLLWVQEAFRVRYRSGARSLVEYIAGGVPRWRKVPATHANLPTSQPTDRVHSPRFMPRWASRLMLVVTSVREERLQDIRAEDVAAEGIRINAGPRRKSKLLRAFRSLWNSLHEQRGYAWNLNPTVTAIGFERK